MDESRLTKYYSEIANKLNEMIPCEWEKVVLYAEEIGNVSSAGFYFFTSDNEAHYSESIPTNYNVTEMEFSTLLRELWKINKKLWLEFKQANEPTWCAFTFELNNDWKFKIKYQYERNGEISSKERKIRWAFDELGIVPKGKNGKKLLKEYLETQGREIPDELQGI